MYVYTLMTNSLNRIYKDKERIIALLKTCDGFTQAATPYRARSVMAPSPLPTPLPLASCLDHTHLWIQSSAASCMVVMRLHWQNLSTNTQTYKNLQNVFCDSSCYSKCHQDYMFSILCGQVKGMQCLSKPIYSISCVLSHTTNSAVLTQQFWSSSLEPCEAGQLMKESQHTQRQMSVLNSQQLSGCRLWVSTDTQMEWKHWQAIEICVGTPTLKKTALYNTF